MTLPDGRILWLFGDTLRPGGSLDSNSFVVQDDNCFRPIFEPLADPAADEWLWPTAGVVEGDVLRVFALHMVDTGPGPFGFDYRRMVIVSFALPNLNPVSLFPAPVPIASTDSVPSYGQTVLEPGDGFVYAYGTTSEGGFEPTHHYVARIPVGTVTTGTWEVWDGTGDPSEWSTTASEAAQLSFTHPDPDPAGPEDGPRAPFAVSTVTSGFLGSALAFDVLSDQLETWDASAPQGPFTFKALAVDIWPGPGDAPDSQFGYGGRVVFNIGPSPIALWSINHDDFNAVIANPSLYKARFETPASASVP